MESELFSLGIEGWAFPVEVTALGQPEESLAKPSAKTGFKPERFVEQPLEEFKCPVCSRIVRQPKECEPCGALICEGCEPVCKRVAMTGETARFVCPGCRSSKPLVWPSKVLVALVNELMIRCKNSGFGCEVTLPVKDIEEHEGVCPHATTKCANRLLCSKRGKDHEFIRVVVPSALLGKSRYGDRDCVRVCSRLCRKLLKMEFYLDQGNVTAAVDLYTASLDQLEHLKSKGLAAETN